MKVRMWMVGIVLLPIGVLIFIANAYGTVLAVLYGPEKNIDTYHFSYRVINYASYAIVIAAMFLIIAGLVRRKRIE